jgi:cytidylate kinase
MRFIDLQEGPNDPGIFKVIFFAGGPGSGKSYVANELGLISRGLKVLNSDDAFEYLMRKRDLSFEMPPEEQPQRDVARQRAKEITNKKQDIYLGGRLGLIIDGTAKDVNKMAKLKVELEAIGYQAMMVFVNTSLKTALQRNLLRDRKVPTDIVVQSHKQVQQNKNSLADVFAPNFVEVSNDENPDFNTPLKQIDKFLKSPITPQARDWVSKAQLQKSVAQEDVTDKTKVIYRVDKEAPMDNTEVLVIGGAGRYSLAGLRNKARREAEALAKDLEVEHGGAFRRAAQNVKQFSNTLNTVVAAYNELNDIRKGGGSRSKGIRNEDVQGKPKVYVDMDGVIANFYAGVTRVTGHEEPRDMALQDIEDTMASFKGTDFFYKLPKYEQTDQLIAMVNAATKGDWYILSSPLKYDREGSAKYKAAWIRDKLKIQPKEMHFMSDKAQFATQPDGTPNILIDDYPKYLNSWKDKGGIGVQYKGHAGNIGDVKDTLDKYFSQKEVAEALDSSYPYEFKNNAYYFITDAGNDYKAVFKGDKKVEVSFMARGENNQPKDDITGTGDSRKVFGTVVNIVKDYVAQNQPEILMFAADNNEPSRIKLYNMLASQAGKSLPGYNFVKKLKSSLFTTFYLTRDNVKVPKLDTAKNLADRGLSKVFNSQQPKLPGRLFSALSEIADSPYDYIRNVKTPDKRAYRFQTDAGQLYRVQVFNRRSETENKLEIHFDLTDMKTGKPETGVTGTGDAVRVFSTVANILQQEVANQDPTGVIIASKADDESRVKLYRTLARRATKLMPDYEVAGEKSVIGADGNPYLTIELAKK